jgi:hypothetical protein
VALLVSRRLKVLRFACLASESVELFLELFHVTRHGIKLARQRAPLFRRRHHGSPLDGYLKV